MPHNFTTWFLFGTTTGDHITGFLVFGVLALLFLWNLYEHLPLKSWRETLGLEWLEETLQEPIPPRVLEEASKQARIDVLARFAERSGR